MAHEQEISADESEAIARVANFMDQEAAWLGGPIGQLFRLTAEGWRDCFGVPADRGPDAAPA
jgi:hypothetical protein